MTDDLQDRFNRLTEQYARAMMDQGSLQAELAIVSLDRDRLASEIVQIRGVLNEVATYEGLVDASPTATLVAELVKDHEELETRIEAVLMLLSDEPLEPIMVETVRLLRGGTRVPDTFDEPDD
jgi:chaperonin cofactor prefoldin